MFPFIEELDKMALQARELIESGEFKKAARLVKKLDRSPYSEGWVHASKLSALINIHQGDVKSAHEQVRYSLCNAWGDPDLLKILRSNNPPIDKQSKCFQIHVSTNNAPCNLLAMCGDDRRVRFIVVAKDEFQAITYLKQMLGIQEKLNPQVIKILVSKDTPVADDLEGVYWNSTFERR